MKVLYKSNLICELIGVGKPGQAVWRNRALWVSWYTSPEEVLLHLGDVSVACGQAFTPTSLCQDCCVILVKVYFDTTAEGVTCCTTAELTFRPPWEALAWRRARALRWL